VAFYIVYIREAHATDVWQDPDDLTDNVLYADPKSAEERIGMGQLCVAKLGIKFPAVVDDWTITRNAPTRPGRSGSTWWGETARLLINRGLGRTDFVPRKWPMS
jgi:hypothetical protein